MVSSHGPIFLDYITNSFYSPDCAEEVKFKIHFANAVNEHLNVYITFQSEELSLNLSNHRVGVAIVVTDVKSEAFLDMRTKVDF